MEDSRRRILVWVIGYFVVFLLAISAGVYGGFSRKNEVFLIAIGVVFLLDYFLYHRIPLRVLLIIHTLLLLGGVYLTGFYLSVFNIFFLLVGTETLFHYGWRRTIYFLLAFLVGEGLLRILAMEGVIPYYSFFTHIERVYTPSYPYVLFGLFVWGGILGLVLWSESKVIEVLKRERDKAQKAKEEMESLSDELIAISSILDTKRERLIRVNRRLEILNRATQFFYTSMNVRDILSYVAKVLKDELKAQKVEAEVFDAKGGENIKYSTEGKPVSLLKDPEVYSVFMQQKEMWLKDTAIITIRTPSRPIGVIRIHYRGDFLTEEERETTLSLIYASGLALNNVLLFEEKEMLSITDPLTGLYNRRIMWEVLNHHFEMWRRENLIFSILLIDIDFFKVINDIYGHLTGDKVLVEVSQILKSSVRKEDMVFRYGGEEFLILLPGVGRKMALDVMERIRKGIHEHTFISDDGREVKITVSAGIVSSDSAGSFNSASDFIRVVDEALYEAKRKRRNLTIIR